MKRPITAAAIFILAATALTACSTGNNDTNPAGNDADASGNDVKWYAENCATQTSTIQERPGELAVSAGPLAAPAALDNSNLKIGYFTYDELNDGMKQEAPLEAGDTICLDRTIRDDADRQKTVDSFKIEGDVDQAQYDNMNFSYVRSPKYPDGIWINQFFDDISRTYAVSDLSDQKCDNQWWPTATQEEARSSGSVGEVKIHHLARLEKC